MKQEIKDRELIIERCKNANACNEEFSKLIKAETVEEFWTVLVANYSWCCDRNILTDVEHLENYEFITNLSHAYLSGFAHDLPNLQSIGGNADLSGFTGKLNPNVTIKGNIYR